MSEIKKKFLLGESCKNLSDEFNVDKTTISKILRCKNWIWVEPELNSKLLDYKRNKEEEIRKEAIMLFDQGKSINQISMLLNVDVRKLSKVLNSKLKERIKNNAKNRKEQDNIKQANKARKEFIKNSILLMKSQGMLNKDIAKMLNIHKTTVTEYLKKYTPQYLRR